MRSVISGDAVPPTAPGPVQHDLFGAGAVAGEKVKVVRERVATPGGESAGAVEDPTPAPTDPMSRITPSAKRLLTALTGEMTRQEILTAISLRDLGNLRQRYLAPCLQQGWIEETIPEKPRSDHQRFRLTAAGRRFVEGLDV